MNKKQACDSKPQGSKYFSFCCVSAVLENPLQYMTQEALTADK